MVVVNTAKTSYVSELNRNGIHAYHFELPNQFFNRSSNKSDDCFSFQDYLPSGVSDASPCYYDTLNDIGPRILTEDEYIRQLLEESNKTHPTNCSQQETKQNSIAESEGLRYVAGYVAHYCKYIDKTLGSKVIPMTTPDNHSWIA
uniref:Uncharacterized protein n=1 Tax=Timema cristinae TaxID=61476 RepID=A0A7R9DDJ7_TIMCR|nr:unnamed protein product [Timema cristinae]